MVPYVLALSASVSMKSMEVRSWLTRLCSKEKGKERSVITNKPEHIQRTHC